jgi:hypothetical protein
LRAAKVFCVNWTFGAHFVGALQSVRGLAHNNGICGLRAPRRAEPVVANNWCGKSRRARVTVVEPTDAWK